MSNGKVPNVCGFVSTANNVDRAARFLGINITSPKVRRSILSVGSHRNNKVLDVAFLGIGLRGSK
ncbi:MAG: hypothetical protein GY804_15285 [Alphaproteobacteria bacterium]|nr:hypothetical protein [Alphaproteobacteria bacterium]